MSKSTYLIVFGGLIFLYVACQKEDAAAENSLAALTSTNVFEIDNVIACASTSNTDQNTVLTYFYPRPGATDFRYYETTSIQDDKNDYTKYQQIDITPTDLFNGYLKKFSRSMIAEKWVIITFFENGLLHLSNPIRLKQKSQPTEFSKVIETDSTSPGMPVFTWQDGRYQDTTIYFQVISDTGNNLLSGTYTFDQNFQYYNVENVVLNITREIPPPLRTNDQYTITLMGVSEDNWVNLIIEKDFNP